MIGNRNRHFREFARMGEENVRSAIVQGAYTGKQLKDAKRWLERRELERQRQYIVENKKANIILAIATAMGALIVSIAAIG